MILSFKCKVVNHLINNYILNSFTANSYTRYRNSSRDVEPGTEEKFGTLSVRQKIVWTVEIAVIDFYCKNDCSHQYYGMQPRRWNISISELCLQIEARCPTLGMSLIIRLFLYIIIAWFFVEITLIDFWWCLKGFYLFLNKMAAP